MAAAAAACGRVVFLFELTHADHSQHVRAVSTWFEPSRAPCSATAAARLAAWVAGGGLDGGSGEMLAACAAAVAPSQRRTKAGLASILCERMRSGCCQHVCMLWHPPGSSRRAHLEEEVVAAREQQPAGPSQHVDPAGVHIGQSCSTCTCMPHHKAAELHVQQLGGNAWLLIHTCSALLRCTCVGASRSCPTAATGAQVMSMKPVAAAAATPYVTRCTAASTSARRP